MGIIPASPTQCEDEIRKLRDSRQEDGERVRGFFPKRLRPAFLFSIRGITPGTYLGIGWKLSHDPLLLHGKLGN